MWKGTEEILSDERAQSKKNKITNDVNVCGTDVRDVPVSLPLFSKGCFTQEEGADAILKHSSRCVSNSSCFFIAVASVITTYLFSIHLIPTLRVPQHGGAYDDTLAARYDFTSKRSRSLGRLPCAQRHIFYGIPSSWDMYACSKSEI